MRSLRWYERMYWWLYWHAPVTRSRAFWDAQEHKVEDMSWHAMKALQALEERPEGEAFVLARGHLYDILDY